MLMGNKMFKSFLLIFLKCTWMKQLWCGDGFYSTASLYISIPQLFLAFVATLLHSTSFSG